MQEKHCGAMVLHQQTGPPPACLHQPSVQKHFHQTLQGSLVWDWLVWGCPSASGGFGVRSRVLYGWNLMPMAVYHCRVRHRPVLYVGLVTEASNFLWLALFTQQKT